MMTQECVGCIRPHGERPAALDAIGALPGSLMLWPGCAPRRPSAPRNTGTASYDHMDLPNAILGRDG